jgi:hypothetical protein
LTKRQLLKDQTQFYPRGGRSLLRGLFKLWVGGNLTPQLFLLLENERDATERFFIIFFLLLFHCHILSLSFYLFFIYFFGLLIFLFSSWIAAWPQPKMKDHEPSLQATSSSPK